MNLLDKSVGEIVALDFRTAAIFSKYKIDFCCGGGKILNDVITTKKITPEQTNKLTQELTDTLTSKGEDNIDYNSFSLPLLISYIKETHHEYIREKAPIIVQFLDKLVKVHGERHPKLLEVNNLFKESYEDLSSHLLKEENILFPFAEELVAIQKNNGTYTPPPFGTVNNPIAMMVEEHYNEGERFEKISAITNGYTPPADACNTYKITYAMLQDFENNLHKHVHLENNILFPKTIKLEQELK